MRTEVGESGLGGGGTFGRSCSGDLRRFGKHRAGAVETSPRGRTPGHLPTDDVSRSRRVQREAAETVLRSLVFMTMAQHVWVHNGTFQLKLGSFRVVSGLRG